MSVKVQVRHFLTEEGWNSFPSLFEAHHRQAASFPGFIALRHSPLSRPSPERELEVTLEFESESLLKQWRSSLAHAQVAAAYQAIWAREPVIKFSAGD